MKKIRIVIRRRLVSNNDPKYLTEKFLSFPFKSKSSKVNFEFKFTNFV